MEKRQAYSFGISFGCSNTTIQTATHQTYCLAHNIDSIVATTRDSTLLNFGHRMLDIGGVVRRLVYTVLIVGVLGLATLLILKSYSLEFAHIVVVNGVTQKAPDDYPRSKIQQVFSSCLEQVEESKNESRYLQQLLTLSHGLEKVQYLESEEVDSLLDNLACN